MTVEHLNHYKNTHTIRTLDKKVKHYVVRDYSMTQIRASIIRQHIQVSNSPTSFNHIMSKMLLEKILSKAYLNKRLDDYVAMTDDRLRALILATSDEDKQRFVADMAEKLRDTEQRGLMLVKLNLLLHFQNIEVLRKFYSDKARHWHRFEAVPLFDELITDSVLSTVKHYALTTISY